MSIVLRLFVGLVLLAPSLVLAATLETPGNGDTLSGIGVIRGWKCEAVGDVTVVIDGGSPLSMAYGNERGDVRNAGACSSAHVGFVSIMNWGNLGDGEHTAVAYDNGVEFARSTFTVTTLGAEFVTGAVGECRMLDFPAPGESTVWEWNEATQGAEALLVEDFAPADQAAFDRRVVGKRAINVSVPVEYINYVSAGRLEYMLWGSDKTPGAYSYEKTGSTTATLTVDYGDTSQGANPHCVYYLTFTSPTTGTYHADPSTNCWEGWEQDGWGDSPFPPVHWELIDIDEPPAPVDQAAFEARMAGKRLVLPGDFQGDYRFMSGGRYAIRSETGTYRYIGAGWKIGVLEFKPDDAGEYGDRLSLIFTTSAVGAYMYYSDGHFIASEEFHIADLP